MRECGSAGVRESNFQSCTFTKEGSNSVLVRPASQPPFSNQKPARFVEWQTVRNAERYPVTESI